MAANRKAILETPYRRKRKRRRLMRRAILIAIFLCILLAGVIFFFRIPALQVRTVSVTGTNEIDPESLRAKAEETASGYYAFILPKKFVAWYPRKKIEAELLESSKELNAVEVHLKGIGKAEIKVVERSPSAIYCVAACYFADAAGLVYKEGLSDGLVVFRDLRADRLDSDPVGTVILDAGTFSGSIAFAKKLADLNLHLKEIVIEANGDMSVATEEGKLIISAVEPFDGQYDFLKTALSQSIFLHPDGSIKKFGYIDLRFGKKIFYTMTPIVQ